MYVNIGVPLNDATYIGYAFAWPEIVASAKLNWIFNMFLLVPKIGGQNIWQNNEHVTHIFKTENEINLFKC